MTKKKCGLTAAEYGQRCPIVLKGAMPDNSRDCQGCEYAR